MNPWLLSISLAYLLGSIPFGYILVRVFLKDDIRSKGSGNIGATNVARSGSKGLGLATVLLDLGKGLAAVLLAKHIAGLDPQYALHTYEIMVAAAVAAVIGHCFPVWLSFRGGKGVATALGVLLALTPRSALALVLIFAIVFALTKYVSLGSVLASAVFPFFAFYFVKDRSPLVIAGFLFIPLLIIVKHHGNISRLLSGTENRWGAKPGSDSGKGEGKVTA